MNTQPKSFFNIFNKQLGGDEISVNSIEIPIIQRDYAQGRETKEVSRIRRQFINVLLNALTDKSEPVKLDFVYGNIMDGRLIPLDGQQRLTTLFLLHWYIVKHEKIDQNEYAFLSNFTYKTRFSSRHFCESLVKSTPDFENMVLSKWIKDQNWFMYSWDKDPTIHSMLVMLDEIHSTFKNESGLWSKLTNVENPPVSFYFLPLHDMGLTDSLYIKMNSRGKPLTEFEHFKAEFEKIIKAVSMDLYSEFVHKADNDWIDMLWKYRGDDNIIDDEFMRYYRFITEMLCYQKSIEIVENDFDLANKVYSMENQNAKENLVFLFKSLDCFVKINDIGSFFDSVFSKFQFEKEKVKIYSEDSDLFMQCCTFYGIKTGERRKFTLNFALLLFAVLQYLLNRNTISDTEFAERIRIIRNLVMNSPDEIRETRMQALLNDTLNIIVRAEISDKTLGYNEIQKNEEIEKISWRKRNSTLIDEINRLEDHFLLQGSISIIGLADTDKFMLRANNFGKLFNIGISYSDVSNALLTINDYSQLASWRFLFGSDNDSTWRELFTQSKQRKKFTETQTTLLYLLDSIRDNFTDYINKAIANFLNDPSTVKDWKYYFIKYSGMREGKSGVYWWRNDLLKSKQNQYEIFMMNTPLSLNGKHWDPFLYVLKKDEGLKNLFTLEDYGDSLVIVKTNERVKCMNSSWEILDCNNTLVKTINIPQRDGIDVEDRIEVFKNYITPILLESN